MQHHGVMAKYCCDFPNKRNLYIKHPNRTYEEVQESFKWSGIELYVNYPQFTYKEYLELCLLYLKYITERPKDTFGKQNKLMHSDDVNLYLRKKFPEYFL